MQNMCCCGTDPVFCLLVHRDCRNQFAYSDVFQFPVKIEIHQADELQIAFAPVSQNQRDETDKLSAGFTVTIGSRTYQRQLVLYRHHRIIKHFAQSRLDTKTVRQCEEFVVESILHTFLLSVFDHRFGISH